jgi:hypothetical protein
MLAAHSHTNFATKGHDQFTIGARPGFQNLATGLEAGLQDCKRTLDHDPIKLNRIMIQMFEWRMIFSENRLPLFGITR